MTRLAIWWHSLRREGVIPTGRRFIRRFVYRSHRCLVTYSSVAGPPAPDHVGAITFRVAERSDLDRLQEFERYGRGSYQRRYVEEDKDWLFLACDRDRIVATRRSSLVIRDSVLSRVIKLGPGQFWGADLFCLPEYRNKNIARHLKIFGDRHLASLGYTEFVSSIEVSNTPSLRASRAAGRQALYYVSFVKMLRWERSRISTHIPEKYWDALSERDDHRSFRESSGRVAMSRLERWGHHVLKHGIADAVRAFVDRYLYHSRRCVITYSPAAGPPAVDHVGDVIFRVATPGDLDRLQELERYGRGGVHRRYVNDEHDWLVIACDGDRIVATRRASRMIRDPVVSRVITLGPGQYWGADVFCLPEYRNRGIGRHLQVFGDRHMASLGYRERFGSVEASNTASLRTSRAAGRQRLYYVSYVRILCWERLRVSKEMPRHLREGP